MKWLWLVAGLMLSVTIIDAVERHPLPVAPPTATPTAVVLEATPTPSDRPRCEVVNGSLRLVCPAGFMPTVTGTSAWCDKLVKETER